jgi:hypothetical protein
MQKIEGMGYKVVTNPFNSKLQIVKFDEEFGMKPISPYFTKKELGKQIKNIINN